MSDSRKAIWMALSKLFLDTDIAMHLESVSQACAQSEFPVEELSKILYEEVAPVCMPNLLSVAGEWTGFDEDQLTAMIFEHKNKKPSTIKKLFRPQWGLIARIYIGKDWQQVVKLIEKKRATTD